MKNRDSKEIGVRYEMSIHDVIVVVKCTDIYGARGICFTGVVEKSNCKDFPVGMESDGWIERHFLPIGQKEVNELSDLLEKIREKYPDRCSEMKIRDAVRSTTNKLKRLFEV